MRILPDDGGVQTEAVLAHERFTRQFQQDTFINWLHAAKVRRIQPFQGGWHECTKPSGDPDGLVLIKFVGVKLTEGDALE